MRRLFLISLLVVIVVAGILSCKAIERSEPIALPAIMRYYPVTGSFTPEMIMFEELNI